MTLSPAAADRDRMLTLADGRRVGLGVYGVPGGEPVIALHGTPACRLMYATADASARRHGLCIYAPDRPGFGDTPLVAGTPEITVPAYADDIARIADGLGLGRFALLGISGGGPYAAAAAARLRGRVTALALVSPLGPIADLPPSVELTRAQRWFFRTLPGWPRVTALGAGLFRVLFRSAAGITSRLFAAGVGGPDRALIAHGDTAAVVRAFTVGALHQGSAAARADHRAFARAWAGDLDAITAPSILWIGVADTIVPVPAALHLGRSIPGCRIVSLDATGHFWMLQRTGEVIETLAALIAQGAARQTTV